MVEVTADIPRRATIRQITIRSAGQSLYIVAITAGIGASILFLVVGVCVELQMFGDGSIFSYAIGAQQAWPFHWHNISGRLFAYVFAHVPAEAYVALTNDPKGGILVYGLLHFSAPLLGLIVTLAADRTANRVIFAYACLSTACLCPLVFGVPTEMLMAHSVFWPALAITLCAPATLRGAAAIFAVLLALVFTHEGAVVLSMAILLAAFLRGGRERIFDLVLAAWFAAMLIWLVTKLTVRPDEYIAGVLIAAAFKFIDIRNLADPVVLLLLATLAGYPIAFVLLRRVTPARAHVYAAFGCVAGLAVYWLWLDTSLLATARYRLRTALLIATPALGLVAALQAMRDEGRAFPFLAEVAGALEKRLNPRLIIGAVLLTMLIHAVETSKFIWAWLNYKTAVQTLATGTASDPVLGDPHLVSSRRIDPGLNRLAWNSTTPYLSVLVAPGLQPTRLVVDPDAGYFWLSCETATKSEYTSIAIPAESRRLVKQYACLHR
jgi:hypothetical protein